MGPGLLRFGFLRTSQHSMPHLNVLFPLIILLINLMTVIAVPMLSRTQVSLLKSLLLLLLAFLPIYLPFFIRGTRILARRRKYLQQHADREAACGLAGAQVARQLLDANNLSEVTVVQKTGRRVANYHSGRQRVSLSSDFYDGSSLYAVTIAAHECGHALQSSTKQTEFKVANFTQIAGSLCLFAAVFLSIFSPPPSGLAIGLGLLLIALGCLIVLIKVTLPLEADASRRAFAALRRAGWITQDEGYAVKKILVASYFSYKGGFPVVIGCLFVIVPLLIWL